MRKDLFVLAVLGCGALPVLAGPQCTAHTTRGFWAATCDGYVAPAPGATLQPARLLSTCTASRSPKDREGPTRWPDPPQELHGQAMNNQNCT
jgi:hypothetical protein